METPSRQKRRRGIDVPKKISDFDVKLAEIICDWFKLQNEDIEKRNKQKPFYLRLFTFIGISWMTFVSILVISNGLPINNCWGKFSTNDKVMVALIRTLWFPPLAIGATYLFGPNKEKGRTPLDFIKRSTN